LNGIFGCTFTSVSSLWLPGVIIRGKLQSTFYNVDIPCQRLSLTPLESRAKPGRRLGLRIRL
jgi:hypothetical protein